MNLLIAATSTIAFPFGNRYSALSPSATYCSPLAIHHTPPPFHPSKKHNYSLSGVFPPSTSSPTSSPQSTPTLQTPTLLSPSSTSPPSSGSTNPSFLMYQTSTSPAPNILSKPNPSNSLTLSPETTYAKLWPQARRAISLARVARRQTAKTCVRMAGGSMAAVEPERTM